MHDGIIHLWTRRQEREGLRGILAAAPDEKDLLGFPGVDAEHSSFYWRELFLDADNCETICKSLANDISKFAEHMDKIVDTVEKDTDKLHLELSRDSFLEAAIAGVLDDKGFGQLIWGQPPKAWGHAESVMRPRWRVGTRLRGTKNDEDSIRYNLQCWAAARIQEKINARNEESEGQSSMQPVEELAPQLATPSPRGPSQHQASPGPSGSPASPSPLEKTPSPSTAMPHAIPQPDGTRQGTRTSTRSSTRASARSTGRPRSGSLPKRVSQPEGVRSRRLRRASSMRGPNAVTPPPRRSARLRSAH